MLRRPGGVSRFFQLGSDGQATVTIIDNDDADGAWAVTIAPSSWESVEVRLPAGRPCEEAGAICAGDGRRLSTGFIKQIPGPTPADVRTGFILMDTSSATNQRVLATLSHGLSIELDTRAADRTASARM